MKGGFLFSSLASREPSVSAMVYFSLGRCGSELVPSLPSLDVLQISRAANTLQQETEGAPSSGGPADIDTLMDELEGEHEKDTLFRC